MTLEDYNNSSPTFQSFVSVVEDDGENPQFFVSAGAHFRGYHLFFNSDLTYHSDYFNGRARITHQIHPQNKVHVYLSRMNDSIENGAFVDFVKKASIVTNHMVVIHVPKSQCWLGETIKMQLDIFRNKDPDVWTYRVILENDHAITLYRYRDPYNNNTGRTNPKYLAVYWGLKARIHYEEYHFPEGKYAKVNSRAKIEINEDTKDGQSRETNQGC